ncbi:sigma-70 factor domain-containing protein [Pedobacter jamesrossensis]|uniref:Sigma-70 factor domain-containing protein n=1 Tax=Pedobacter jamesrossensis TaxID=1908238 RepID=A0ABV8NI90_9SPHI
MYLRSISNSPLLLNESEKILAKL